MNASSPDPDQRPNRDVRAIERHLQRLRPQPLTLTAPSIVAAAENRTPGDTRADEPAPSPVVPAPTTPSHPWSLVAVGISGFAAGILLTYVVMSRAIETTAPPVVINPPVPAGNVEPTPLPQPAAQSGAVLASDAPLRPSLSNDSPSATSTDVLADASAALKPDAWQSWRDASQTHFNAEMILAVRGSQPRNDLAGLSSSRSRYERQATPILQPTLNRGMGIPAGSTPNQYLDQLLGPL